jgi:shikimate dehydrogenase
MKRYAVIGHPIGHSLSPLMHNTAFQHLGIDAQYEKLDIAPADLQTEITKFRNSDWGGFNITTPYKEAVIPFLDEVSQEAESIHSVNAVVNRDGQLFGTNTDVLGIWYSLRSYHMRIDNHPCIVLGAGGVAASVLFVLTKYVRPKQITIVARTFDKAVVLHNRFKLMDCPIKVIGFSDDILNDVVRQSSLIVNCTTVGMFPNNQNTPLPGNQFHKDQIIYDLIYRPLQTQFLKDAQVMGATILDGLDMFIQQGAAAYRLWTGKEMPILLVRQALEKALTS